MRKSNTYKREITISPDPKRHQRVWSNGLPIQERQEKEKAHNKQSKDVSSFPAIGCICSQTITVSGKFKKVSNPRGKNIRKRTRKERKPNNNQRHPENIKLLQSLDTQRRPRKPISRHRPYSQNGKDSINNRECPERSAPVSQMRRNTGDDHAANKPERVARAEAGKGKVLPLRGLLVSSA